VAHHLDGRQPGELVGVAQVGEHLRGADGPSFAQFDAAMAFVPRFGVVVRIGLVLARSQIRKEQRHIVVELALSASK
jgi:hypothetical protein